MTAEPTLMQPAGSAMQTSSSELKPSSYPLAILPSMITPKTVKVDLFDKIKGIHDIRDLETDKILLTVSKDDDSLFHVTQQVKDAQENLLFEIKERQSTDDRQLYLKDTNEKRSLLAGLEKSGRTLANFDNKAPGQRQHNSETLYITSLSRWPQDGMLYITNQRTVALVHREDDEYQVAVAANVDIALIVAVCVCFDFKARKEGHEKDGKNKDDQTSTSAMSDIFDGLSNVVTIFGGGDDS